MVIRTATVADIIDQSAQVLADAGCENSDADAKQIVALVLSVDPEELGSYVDVLSGYATAQIEKLVERRSRREPLEYIMGKCCFRRLTLEVDARVIVPLEESGALVDIAKSLEKGARVHEVGVGSGAISLAIKDERPDLLVSGSDIARGPVDVARANADRLGLDVTFTLADGLPPGAKYDLVVANLPYNNDSLSVIDDPPEMTHHQPYVSMFGGGEDGLDTVRKVVRSVEPGVMLALQHAGSQTPAVRVLLDEPDTTGDLSGPACFTVGRTPIAGDGQTKG